MKLKVLLIYLIAILAYTATSCKKASYLKADKSSVTFCKLGGSETINLQSDGEGFDIESAPEWVKASIEGTQLILEVDKYEAQSGRHSSVTVSINGQKLEIPVHQNGIATKLNPETTIVQFTKNGGSKKVKVDTDGDLGIVAPEFVTATFENGFLNITVNANGGAEKSGKICLYADSFSSEISVKVEGSVCPTCKGKGTITCPKCNGSGFVEEYILGAWRSVTCPKCDPPHDWGEEGDAEYWMDASPGLGYITCPTCGGKGK